MYQQNYTREAERKQRRREQEREAMKELLWILALFVFLLWFVWACMRAIILSAADYETPVVVEQETEHFREVTKMIEEVEPCPLEVSTFYNVPLDIDLQAYIINECTAYGIDPAVVFALIERETNFRAGVVGDDGKSVGLCQIQERWHKDRMERLGVTDLLNPYENVCVGIDYLGELVNRGNGLEWALAAYNAGPSGANKGYGADYASGILERSEALEVVTADVLFR